MKKRIFIFVLTLLLIMPVLAACGNDETPAPPAAQEDDGAAATDDDNEVAEVSNVNPVGVFPIVNETITLSIFMSTWENFEVEDNSALDWFQDITNINLDVIWETDGTMRTLLLASGDYPDIFHGDASFTNLEVENYGVRQGIFIELDDLIEQYSEIVKEHLRTNEEYRISATASNGRIHGLPRMREEVFSHPMAPSKFWINTNFLDALGLDMPTTTDEFRTVMLAFLNDDPNGNGMQDEIPISGAINTARGEPEYFLLNAFTYVDSRHFLRKDDGVVSFVANTEEYREGLRFVNELYELGLIDPSAFTQDLAQLTQLGTSEVEVLGSFAALHPAMAIDIADQERSSHYAWLPPLRGPQGAQYAVYGGTAGFYDSVNVVITDRCQYPEAAMRMIDFMYSEKVQMHAQGPEGGRWDWVDDPSLLDMYGEPARIIFHEAYVADALREGVSDRFPLALSATLWGRHVADVHGDIFDPMNYEVRLAQATLAYAPFFPTQTILPYKFDQETAEELSTLMVSIISHVQQATTRFIVGDMCIDNDWDAFVRGLEGLNVARYVEIHQEGADNLLAMR